MNEKVKKQREYIAAMVGSSVIMEMIDELVGLARIEGYRRGYDAGVDDTRRQYGR